MEITGFLGTRADLIIDIVMTASALLPAFMIYAFTMAAKGKLELHKKLQITAFIAVTLLVIALEVDVHFGFKFWYIFDSLLIFNKVFY